MVVPSQGTSHIMCGDIADKGNTRQEQVPVQPPEILFSICRHVHS